MRGIQTEHLLIPIMNDNVYEGGANERFLIMIMLERGSLDGRISIQPPFVEITIEDNNPRPGNLN